MASVVESIWNRALQKLGAKRVTSMTENSVNARACQACYMSILEGELSDHVWNFAIQRFQLAADATEPLHSVGYKYALPAGYMKLAPPDAGYNTNYRDWKIEGGYIFTDESSPLNVRCVVLETDVAKMHPLFREAVACKMAEQMAEELTQSSSKKIAAHEDYNLTIARARKANAYEKVSQEMPEDEWVTARSC